MSRFYPTIDEYLEQTQTSLSIPTKGLEEMVCSIQAHTGCSNELARLIVQYFFEEIRSAILRGDSVVIDGLGRFELSSPKVTNNKERIFVKFKTSKKLSDRLNGKV